jgi:hypothetical protein
MSPSTDAGVVSQRERSCDNSRREAILPSTVFGGSCHTTSWRQQSGTTHGSCSQGGGSPIESYPEWLWIASDALEGFR